VRKQALRITTSTQGNYRQYGGQTRQSSAHQASTLRV
jgi:hypothetical protein